MKKQLKVKYSNPYNNFPLSKFALLKQFPKNIQINEVNSNQDLIIEYLHKKFTKEFFDSKKSLLISGENLYYPINLFKLYQYLQKKTKLPFENLNRILPKKALNIKLGLMRPKYYKYVKNLSRKTQKGKYALISNEIKGKNIFNLPYFLQRPFKIKNFEKKKIKKIPKRFCCIILSNESAFDRIEFTKKLSRYKKVDIYGKTSLTNSDNSELPKSWANNSKFYSQYKFVICFENSFEKEYITEKLPNVMLGNSIPIYRGAPNIAEYFNTNSFINYEDYGKSYDNMIKKIIELDKNDKKYLEFINQKWMAEKNIKKIKNEEKELKLFLNKVVND